VPDKTAREVGEGRMGIGEGVSGLQAVSKRINTTSRKDLLISIDHSKI
jgi:hypothetical protein